MDDRLGVAAIVISLVALTVTIGMVTGDEEQGMAPRPGLADATNRTSAPRSTVPVISDGYWIVGEDIPPGTYKAAENVPSDCYWKILRSGTNGEDIIANDLPGGGRPKVVLEVGHDFKTEDCGLWQKIDAEIAPTPSDSSS